jgi:hypothetical protein
MTDNGNNPEITIASPPNRIRASGPILILAILFVVASFLTWYLTWFGRGLSDSEITKYLSDYSHPRHVQHALLQVQERIERGDKAASLWYPQIVALAGNPETQFRLTSAWVMGSDNSSENFHNALKTLLTDSEPIVRRNAALALVRFGDASGRDEIGDILFHYTVKAPYAGVVVSILAEGTQVSRGGIVARIQQDNHEVITVRSPFNGTVITVLGRAGRNISHGDPLLMLNSDEQSVWEALRGLAIVGVPEQLWLVERYNKTEEPFSDRIKQQAAVTEAAIKSRMNVNEKSTRQ